MLDLVKLTVNGVEYDSWDDVPEEQRASLARVLPDDAGTGVPDVFEESPAVTSKQFPVVSIIASPTEADPTPSS